MKNNNSIRRGVERLNDTSTVLLVQIYNTKDYKDLVY